MEKIYYNYEELETAIRKYVRYYNEIRKKERFRWLSPIEYRKQLPVA